METVVDVVVTGKGGHILRLMAYCSSSRSSYYISFMSTWYNSYGESFEFLFLTFLIVNIAQHSLET